MDPPKPLSIFDDGRKVPAFFVADFTSTDQDVKDLNVPRPETKWCLLEVPKEQLEQLEAGACFYFQSHTGGTGTNDGGATLCTKTATFAVEFLENSNSLFLASLREGDHAAQKEITGEPPAAAAPSLEGGEPAGAAGGPDAVAVGAANAEAAPRHWCEVFAQVRGQLIVKPTKVNSHRVRELLATHALGHEEPTEAEEPLPAVTRTILEYEVAASPAELHSLLDAGPYVEVEGAWRLLPAALEREIVDAAVTLVAARGWCAEDLDAGALLREIQQVLGMGAVPSLSVLRKALRGLEGDAPAAPATSAKAAPEEATKAAPAPAPPASAAAATVAAAPAAPAAVPAGGLDAAVAASAVEPVATAIDGATAEPVATVIDATVDGPGSGAGTATAATLAEPTNTVIDATADAGGAGGATASRGPRLHLDKAKIAHFRALQLLRLPPAQVRERFELPAPEPRTKRARHAAAGGPGARDSGLQIKEFAAALQEITGAAEPMEPEALLKLLGDRVYVDEFEGTLHTLDPATLPSEPRERLARLLELQAHWRPDRLGALIGPVLGADQKLDTWLIKNTRAVFVEIEQGKEERMLMKKFGL